MAPRHGPLQGVAGRDVLGYLVLESDKANSAYRLATLAQMPLAISARGEQHDSLGRIHTSRLQRPAKRTSTA